MTKYKVHTNRWPRPQTNILWRNMSALLVGLLSFQGVIALRDRLVGIFKPGLFTWVRAQAVLTDAAVKCAWIDSCVFVRSCSALHGWSPLSFWSSCSQWSLGHQMMWVKRERCCEHQLALALGVRWTLCRAFKVLILFWIIGPHQQSDQIQVHKLQRLWHDDVHVCCWVWLHRNRGGWCDLFPCSQSSVSP